MLTSVEATLSSVENPSSPRTENPIWTEKDSQSLESSLPVIQPIIQPVIRSVLWSHPAWSAHEGLSLLVVPAGDRYDVQHLPCTGRPRGVASCPPRGFALTPRVLGMSTPSCWACPKTPVLGRPPVPSGAPVTGLGPQRCGNTKV